MPFSADANWPTFWELRTGWSINKHRHHKSLRSLSDVANGDSIIAEKAAACVV